MDMLAKQLSQIATSLSEMRGNEGMIPASVQPPDRENISQITLRSGPEYDDPSTKEDKGSTPTPSDKKTGTREVETGKVRTEDDNQSRNGKRLEPQEADQHFSGPEVEVEIEEIRREAGESSKGDSRNKERQVKPFPYKGGLKKKKEDPADFMEIFGKLEINLPFLQALNLPIFNKFIKEFITGKTEPSGKIIFGETVSAVIQKRRMPYNRTDPGMFILPISTGNIKVEHAMCDLGASINVLPLSLYKKLEGVRVVDTKVVIQLADRSCISPEGVLENVIVKVHDFLYPADLHVIKMSEYQSAESSGVLLGRPRSAFNINEALKKPLDIENVHAVDVINPLVKEFLETELMQEQVENSELSHSIDKEVANWCEVVNTLGMIDEELANAILEFCKSHESVRSKELAYVSNVENLPGPEGLITKEAKKNPLPQETSSTKKELKTFPQA
ncbi:uncharacterized protein LOC121757541 [Salvia splendens]|uniref:uncharacterized protein LOC121757541 n=1 Tax=Salvia splendens TaxID=180675 RepID=UPI001C2751D5|nr:uncharacterized protein LOC121757541 [Salvia splendens]